MYVPLTILSLYALQRCIVADTLLRSAEKEKVLQARKAQKCLMQAPRLVCLPPTNWSQCQPYSDAIVDTHPIWLKMEQEAQFPALAWSPGREGGSNIEFTSYYEAHWLLNLVT